MNFLMLSCKTASGLTDKRLVVKLTIREEVMWHVHISMCEYCTAYKRQSVILDQMLQNQSQMDDPDHIPAVSNAGLKDRLLSRLK